MKNVFMLMFDKILGNSPGETAAPVSVATATKPATLATAPSQKIELGGLVGRVELDKGNGNHSRTKSIDNRGVAHQEKGRYRDDRREHHSMNPLAGLKADVTVLRRTYGNGLASGQILAKTQRDTMLPAEGEKPKCDFVVLAHYLPTDAQRMADCVVRDESSQIFYDRGPYVHGNGRFVILEVKVESDPASTADTPLRKVWVRLCYPDGNVYRDPVCRWQSMDAERIPLMMGTQDMLDAVREFTDLDYPKWDKWELQSYRSPVMSNKQASIFAQKLHLE